MNSEEFLNHYVLNAPQIMWFLGAGTSRSAGMPSATDIIWDLKRKFYCNKENQDITDNELSNEAIKKKIQNYLESNGCPQMWSEEEYAFYFKLVLGDDPALHQKYLEGKLKSDHLSINSGHKILAALMDMQKVKVVFTTNFDEVIETAFAFMTGKNLQAFNLNGSYAPLNALNNEQFPIYAKMHGDFRYFEMKNLPEQLQENDAEIEKCFINACSRYGLVISGYSGRDKNVLNAFEKALDNPNAFPKGLFWITSIQGNIFPAVTDLINKAKSKGIMADIIEADTFDAFLNSIWKQIENKNDEHNKKIRKAIFEIPKIKRFPSSTSFPLIRTNAFAITSMQKTCLSIETTIPITTSDFKERVINAKSSAITTKEKSILAWGANNEIYKIVPEELISNSAIINITDHLKSFNENTLLNAFYSRALSVALVRNKALKLRRKKENFYAVVSSKDENFENIKAILKKGLAVYDFNKRKTVEPTNLSGTVPNVLGAFWMESVQISLEYIDGKFYLILVPDIWIEPLEKRRDARDFITDKKKSRYNQVQNNLLDAWKQILLGTEKQVIVEAFNNEESNNAIFTLSTTTAFSYRYNN